MKGAALGEKVAVRAGSDCSQRTQTTIFLKEEVVAPGTPGIHPHHHSFPFLPDIFSPLPLSPSSYYILKIHESRVFIFYAQYCIRGAWFSLPCTGFSLVEASGGFSVVSLVAEQGL